MATKQGFPFFDMDFTKAFTDFRMPGFDVDAAIAMQRRNVEAMTAAIQMTFDGMQAVTRRQAEASRQMLDDMSAMMNEMASNAAPEEKLSRQADLAKASFEKTVANLREVADMAAKSNADAANVLNKRVSESLDEIKSAAGKKKAQPAKAAA